MGIFPTDLDPPESAGERSGTGMLDEVGVRSGLGGAERISPVATKEGRPGVETEEPSGRE